MCVIVCLISDSFLYFYNPNILIYRQQISFSILSPSLALVVHIALPLPTFMFSIAINFLSNAKEHCGKGRNAGLLQGLDIQHSLF